MSVTASPDGGTAAPESSIPRALRAHRVPRLTEAPAQPQNPGPGPDADDCGGHPIHVECALRRKTAWDKRKVEGGVLLIRVPSTAATRQEDA